MRTTCDIKFTIVLTEDEARVIQNYLALHSFDRPDEVEMLFDSLTEHLKNVNALENKDD